MKLFKRFLVKNILVIFIALYAFHLCLSWGYFNIDWKNFEETIYQLHSWLDLIRILLFSLVFILLIWILVLKFSNKLRIESKAVSGLFIIIVIIFFAELPIYYCFIDEGAHSFWNGLHLR